MLIIERVEVAANLSKIEADLFHDLNQLIDAINNYHLQHTLWLEDDLLADQKHLRPSQYSDQKMVSLLIKRQKAEHQRIITIAGNRQSSEHIAFINQARESNNKRLTELKRAIKSTQKDLYLLNNHRELAVIELSKRDEDMQRAENTLTQIESMLARDKHNAELIYQLGQARSKYTTAESCFIECNQKYQAMVTEITQLTDQKYMNEREAAQIKNILLDMDASTEELESDVQPYFHTLHLTAMELAVVANLTDMLALAIGAAKRSADIFPGILSSDSMLKLEKLDNDVTKLRIGIIDHMLVFIEVNHEHRQHLLRARIINKHGDRLRESTETARLEPLEHPDLKDFKFDLHYIIPDYVDSLYFIKKDLNALTNSNHFPEDRALLPDASYVDKMPPTLLRNNTAFKDSSVRKYFDWYCKQTESGATINRIHDQVAAIDLVAYNEVDQLMLLADHHSDRHTVTADIVARANIMIHDLTDELAKNWKKDFINQCDNIFVHVPKVAPAPKPIGPQPSAQSVLAQNHAWDIVEARTCITPPRREHDKNKFFDKIKTLLSELTAEIIRDKNKLANSIFDFFKHALEKEIRYKEAKRVSLEGLLKSETFDDLVNNAAKLSNDPIVTRTIIRSRSRTHVLLLEIIERAGHQSPRAKCN